MVRRYAEVVVSFVVDLKCEGLMSHSLVEPVFDIYEPLAGNLLKGPPLKQIQVVPVQSSVVSELVTMSQGI